MVSTSSVPTLAEGAALRERERGEREREREEREEERKKEC